MMYRGNERGMSSCGVSDTAAVCEQSVDAGAVKHQTTQANHYAENSNPNAKPRARRSPQKLSATHGLSDNMPIKLGSAMPTLALDTVLQQGANLRESQPTNTSTAVINPEWQRVSDTKHDIKRLKEIILQVSEADSGLVRHAFLSAIQKWELESSCPKVGRWHTLDLPFLCSPLSYQLAQGDRAGLQSAALVELRMIHKQVHARTSSCEHEGSNAVGEIITELNRIKRRLIKQACEVSGMSRPNWAMSFNRCIVMLDNAFAVSFRPQSRPFRHSPAGPGSLVSSRATANLPKEEKQPMQR